jgi:hypothetical protein
MQRHGIEHGQLPRHCRLQHERAVRHVLDLVARNLDTGSPSRAVESVLVTHTERRTRADKTDRNMQVHIRTTGQRHKGGGAFRLPCVKASETRHDELEGDEVVQADLHARAHLLQRQPHQRGLRTPLARSVRLCFQRPTQDAERVCVGVYKDLLVYICACRSRSLSLSLSVSHALSFSLAGVPGTGPSLRSAWPR